MRTITEENGDRDLLEIKCLRACVCACVRVCVCACVRVCVRVCDVCVRMLKN